MQNAEFRIREIREIRGSIPDAIAAGRAAPFVLYCGNSTCGIWAAFQYVSLLPPRRPATWPGCIFSLTPLKKSLN